MRTSGSAGGSGKRIGGNADTAPRLDPDHPWTSALIAVARSVRVLPDQRCNRQRRMTRPMRLRSSSPIAGRRLTKLSVHVLIASGDAAVADPHAA